MLTHKMQITVYCLNHLYKGMNMKPLFKKVSDLLQNSPQSCRQKKIHVVIPKLLNEYFNRKHEIKNRITSINFGICTLYFKLYLRLEITQIRTQITRSFRFRDL